MRWLRFYSGDREIDAYVEEDGVHVQPVLGSPFGEHKAQGERILFADLKLAPPVRPSKILAVAVNYRSHLGERSESTHPELFLKPPSAIVGPEDAIVLPAGSERVDYEGEVVVVIGRRLRNVSEAKAIDGIFGYTCGNDVSARDWQRGDRQWWRAKGSDTFAALGPWIETDLDPNDINLRTIVDGEERQSTNTKLLIHSIARVISFASEVMTLEPGDIIYTGTPGTTQPLQPGEVVEVEVEGVGTLRNVVQEAS